MLLLQKTKLSLKKEIDEMININSALIKQRYRLISQILRAQKLLPEYSALKLKRVLNDAKHKSVIKILEQNISCINRTYPNEIGVEKPQNTIWMLWWQGTDGCPSLIQDCIERVKDFNPEMNLILITESNVKDYCKLPDIIYSKFHQGAFSITHFSDIIRNNLLKEYGGVWLDASTFSTGRIPDEIIDSTFYSKKGHGGSELNHWNISLGLWCSPLVAGKNSTGIFHFMDDFYIEYWKKFDFQIDYFVNDYAYSLAYNRNIAGFKNIIDALPYDSQPDYWYLINRVTDKWDVTLQNRLKTNNTQLYKLTQKKKIDFEKLKQDDERVYSQLFKLFPIKEEEANVI